MRRNQIGWLLIVVFVTALAITFTGRPASGQWSAGSQVELDRYLRTQERIADSLEDISRSLSRIADLQEQNR